MKENQVYLDTEQCNTFSANYRGKYIFSVRADALLSSKFSGYDDYHYDLLQPFKSKLITLVRTNSDFPGWYSIKELAS